MKYDENDRENTRKYVKRIRNKVNKRLEVCKIKNGVDIAESLPDHLYPYKCSYCGKNLMPDWCESDIEKNVACFDKTGKLYDICLACEDKLRLVSKLKHSDEPPHSLISRW